MKLHSRTPSLLQDSTSLPAFLVRLRNRVHVIVRTPNGNDYVRDLLRRHYHRSRHQQVDSDAHHNGTRHMNFKF